MRTSVQVLTAVFFYRHGCCYQLHILCLLSYILDKVARRCYRLYRECQHMNITLVGNQDHVSFAGCDFFFDFDTQYTF